MVYSLQARERLGDYLVLKGMISESELEVALCEQKRHYRLLGDILLELGFVKEEEFYPLLGDFLGYPYVDLSKIQVNPECLQLLPPEKMKESVALVFQCQGSQLHIALADPENVFIKNQLRNLLEGQGDLLFYLAPLREILTKYQNQTSPQSKTTKTAVEPLIQEILSQAVARNASDIHFIPEPKLVQLYYRIDGILQKQQTLHAESWQRLAIYLKLIAKLDISETRQAQDGRFDFIVSGEQVDCRLSVIPTIHAESVVIRILRKEKGILDIRQLGFKGTQLLSLQQLSQQPQGLFLIAGPTGSGKTTTLYALLNEIEWASRNVVTIEDPVEYVIPGIRQSEIQPGGMKISEALRALLRHDPDVIYISEIRDQETANLAIQASLTGHLVLATLHANDISSIPLRLKELKADTTSLSSTLIGMMSQRLLRRYCSECRGEGCLSCNESGYRGRLAIAEIQMMTVYNRGKVTQQPTLQQQAEALVAAKVTSVEEVTRVLGVLDAVTPGYAHRRGVANVVSF